MNAFPLRAVRFRAWALFFAWTCFLTTCSAHDPGLSFVTVQMDSGKIDALMVLSTKDAEALIGTRSAHANAPALLTKAAREGLRIVCDQQKIRLDGIRSDFDGESNATVRLQGTLQGGAALVIHSDFISRLPPGHRQFITVKNARGEPIAEKLLSAKSASLSLELGNEELSASRPVADHPFVAFLLLGVKHILTGYDHLLFLLGLLLATRKVVPMLQIVTAFTAAHSITLALAVFDVIRVPASIVEPIIAASLIYVGIENMVRAEMPRGRVKLTFAFGLIHGLGFASALRDSGLGANGSSVLVPLISFNVGVEIGQLLIAGLALPLLGQLAASPLLARRFVPVCSALVILFGTYTLVQRLWP